LNVASVRAIISIRGFDVELEFSDGTRRVIDLEPYLHGPIFQPARSDPQSFRSVTVDERAGTLVWPNGADICPDVLYHGRTPAFMERPDGDSG
jgi:hypothetical protein